MARTPSRPPSSPQREGTVSATLLAQFEDDAQAKLNAALSRVRTQVQAAAEAPEVFLFISVAGETDRDSFKVTENLKVDLAYYPPTDDEEA